MRELNNIALFERYLENEMPGDERTEFEQRLNSEAGLKAQFDDHLTFREEIRLAERDAELKKLFETYHNELGGKPAEPKVISIQSRRRMWLSIAASIVVVMGSSVFFWQYETEQGNAGADNDFLQTVSEESEPSYSTDDKVESVVTRTATAFLIDENGFLLTNYHAVKDYQSIVVEIAGDSLIEVNANVVSFDQHLDIAVLQLDTAMGIEFERIPFKINGGANRGEDVFTIGFPSGKHDVVYEPGTISSVSGYKDDTASYQVSIAINEGNSGSPLFNDRGELIGIINGKHAKADGASYALKSKDLLVFVDSIIVSNSIAIELPVKNYLRYEKRPTQIELLERFIFRIRVTR